MQKFLEIHFVALLFLTWIPNEAMNVKCLLFMSIKTNLYVIYKDIHMD